MSDDLDARSDRLEVEIGNVQRPRRDWRIPALLLLIVMVCFLWWRTIVQADEIVAQRNRAERERNRAENALIQARQAADALEDLRTQRSFTNDPAQIAAIDAQAREVQSKLEQATVQAGP